MLIVKSLLKEKGSRVWTTTPETSVFDALKLMAEVDIGALVVMHEDKLVGIFSERDYARKVILKGKFSKNTPVREIMTSEVITIRPQQLLTECMAIMNRHRIRYLPVVENSEVVGIISIGDVLNAIIADLADELDRLMNADLEISL